MKLKALGPEVWRGFRKTTASLEALAAWTLASTSRTCVSAAGQVFLREYQHPGLLEWQEGQQQVDPSWQALLGVVLVVLVGKCCRFPLSITPQALDTWCYRWLWSHPVGYSYSACSVCLFSLGGKWYPCLVASTSAVFHCPCHVVWLHRCLLND